MPKVPKVKGTKMTITCFGPVFIGLKWDSLYYELRGLAPIWSIGVMEYWPALARLALNTVLPLKCFVGVSTELRPRKPGLGQGVMGLEEEKH